MGRAQQEYRNLYQMANTVDRRASNEIVEEAMTMGRHRQQIDAAFLRKADELRGRVAHRQLGRDLESMRSEIGGDPREVIAVVLHLLRLAQLQLIEIARRPSVGDVHQEQLRANQQGEPTHVLQNRLVGRGMFDGNENAAIHTYASV